MKSLKIEKGNTESAPFIIGHWKLGAVFTPPVALNFFVEILGSHDGISFGRINEGLRVPIGPKYAVRTFDPGVFDGISAVKFTLEIPELEQSSPYGEDLEFFIHLKDT